MNWLIHCSTWLNIWPIIWYGSSFQIPASVLIMKKNQWINQFIGKQTYVTTWHDIPKHTSNIKSIITLSSATYLHTRLNQHAHIACMEPLELQQRNIKYQTRFCPRVSKRSSNSWQWVDMTSMRSASDNALAIACSTCEFLNSLMGKNKNHTVIL